RKSFDLLKHGSNLGSDENLDDALRGDDVVTVADFLGTVERVKPIRRRALKARLDFDDPVIADGFGPTKANLQFLRGEDDRPVKEIVESGSRVQREPANATPGLSMRDVISVGIGPPSK